MKLTPLSAVLCTSLALSSLNVQAQTDVLIDLRPTSFEEVGMTEAVQKECGANIGTAVGRSAQKVLATKGLQVKSLDGDAPEPSVAVLSVELIRVVAPGGGGWSGAKSVSVRASVVRDGELLSSVVLQDSARGSGFSGTCALVENAAEGAGEKVAAWFLKAKARDYQPDQLLRAAPIAVLAPARFLSTDVVPEAVLKECSIDMALVARLQGALSRYYREVKQVESVAAAEPYRLVSMTILEVIAPHGGSASGAKSMRVRFTLSEGGHILAEHEAHSAGGRGGIFGPVFKSGCSILDAVALQIAKNSARWIVSQDDSKRAPIEKSIQQPASPTAQ